MTILSDKTIKQEIRKGTLTITPLTDDMIQPSSIDLQLGDKWKTWNTKTTIDTHKQYNLEQDMNTTTNNKYTIQPGEFLLATTKQKITLPSHLTGRIEGRSSIGRLGVTMHITAGYIDPGFSGHITLEIINHSPRPVILYEGQRTCQLVLETMTTPSDRPYSVRGKYMNQVDPLPSRIHEDK